MSIVPWGWMSQARGVHCYFNTQFSMHILPFCYSTFAIHNCSASKGSAVARWCFPSVVEISIIIPGSGLPEFRPQAQ